MVGTTGFEPATSSVSRKRSNQLSYAPKGQLHVVYQDRGGGGKMGAETRHAVPSLTDEEPFFAGARILALREESALIGSPWDRRFW